LLGRFVVGVLPLQRQRSKVCITADPDTRAVAAYFAQAGSWRALGLSDARGGGELRPAGAHP
jgi:hypothetical protein